jgi:hypothetical protein
LHVTLRLRSRRFLRELRPSLRRAPSSREPPPDVLKSPEVAKPRAWLLSAGWRRHGLVDPAEVPGR